MSAILVPSVIGLFALDHRLGRQAWILLAFCLLACLRCVYELSDLLSTRQLRPRVAACTLLAPLTVGSAWMHLASGSDAGQTAGLLSSLGWLMAVWGTAFLVLLAVEAACFESPGRSMESLGSSLITVAYGGLLLALTAQLRWFPRPETGYFALASIPRRWDLSDWQETCVSR